METMWRGTGPADCCMTAVPEAPSSVSRPALRAQSTSSTETTKWWLCSCRSPEVTRREGHPERRGPWCGRSVEDDGVIRGFKQRDIAR